MLQDLKVAQPDGMLSSRILDEYDCKEERTRIIYLSKHSGSMGTGKMLFDTGMVGNWRCIPPNGDVYKQFSRRSAPLIAAINLHYVPKRRSRW